MNQPRIESLIEALANALLSMAIGLVSQLVVFPAVGVHARLSQNIAILAAFTIIGVVRNYTIRRVSNRYLHRFAVWLARRLSS